jgi:hypothetical protein
MFVSILVCGGPHQMPQYNWQQGVRERESGSLFPFSRSESMVARSTPINYSGLPGPALDDLLTVHCYSAQMRPFE